MSLDLMARLITFFDFIELWLFVNANNSDVLRY